MSDPVEIATTKYVQLNAEHELLLAERNVYWNALRAIERDHSSSSSTARIALDIGEDARRGKFKDAPR